MCPGTRTTGGCGERDGWPRLRCDLRSLRMGEVTVAAADIRGHITSRRRGGTWVPRTCRCQTKVWFCPQVCASSWRVLGTVVVCALQVHASTTSILGRHSSPHPSGAIESSAIHSQGPRRHDLALQYPRYRIRCPSGCHEPQQHDLVASLCELALRGF